MSTPIIPGIRRDNVVSNLKKGIRSDGRGLDEVRPLTIDIGMIKQSEGSAYVQLGSTKVYCGISSMVGSPFSDRPKSGVLTTSAEMRPLASPTFELGPPKPPMIELARVIDRGIRESDCLGMGERCIVEGEKVWVFYQDIHPVDYQGNLFDAGTLGCVAAFASALLPAEKFDIPEDEKVKLKCHPLTTTFAKIGDVIVTDPNLDEEECCDTRLTISTSEGGRMHAMQKGGGSGRFTMEEVNDCVQRAIRHNDANRAYLKKVCGIEE